MTADQYKAAAKAINDYRWILAAALSGANIEQTRASDKAMSELAKLQEALEKEGMKRIAEQEKA